MGSQLSYKFRLQPLTAVNIFPDCFRRWSASCKMPWRRRSRPPDGQCVSAARTDLLQDPLRDDKDEDSRLPESLNQGTLKSSKISECLHVSTMIYYMYRYIYIALFNQWRSTWRINMYPDSKQCALRVNDHMCSLWHFVTMKRSRRWV